MFMMYNIYVFVFLFPYYFLAGLVIITLNINGLNNVIKQKQLVNFVNYHKIDILMLQEHNIRDKNKLCQELRDAFVIDINLAVSFKGGTAILINRKTPIQVLSSEKSADSRVMSMKFKYYEEIFHLVNIYAHSGTGYTAERENLFSNDLNYYLRHNLQRTIIGGDFNCVLSERDTSSQDVTISKALLNLIRTLNFKDLWCLKHKHIKYTYVKQNYGSRIDRLYAKDLSNFTKSTEILNVSFSDHLCVKIEIGMPNIPKAGPFYWKLNTSLLDLPNIEDRFKNEWSKITSTINRFPNINKWWDNYAKSQIKSFFIKIGKEENQKKYGLINYLEFSLNKKYNDLSISGSIDYSEVKRIKDRIDDLKVDILNGVRIRSRIDEQLQGENISAYLIRKQANVNSKHLISSIKTEAGIIDNVEENTILNTKDSINLYISKYYDKLYKEEIFDPILQEQFLNFIDRQLSNDECLLLEVPITINEIFNAIKKMNINKSPGLDGLPIEFYIKFWEIIKNEITKVIINITKGMLLEEKQRRAIITLIHKDGDLNQLKNWRPISLICADTKIVAKILAIRLSKIMNNLISDNQFCCPNRTIIECNNKIRDMLFYLNQKNVTGAILNLDWEKAFDRVNWTFLSKILAKMGFPQSIITWFMIFYKDIESMCMINGSMTTSFRIERGVRQGCPLSMIAFVIFQEPLYRALHRHIHIIPPNIPGEITKNVGYADDTTIFIMSERSLVESFNVLQKFEKASNSKLNIRKTKIYSFGDWQGRIVWPIQDIKVEMEHFKALGIIHSIDYNKAIDIQWKSIYNKMDKRIQIIKSRYFTLYQKAALINSLIASKIWYTAHTYPLPMSYVKLINNVIFRFIWNSNANPIKRDVLCSSKLNGGIGLLNIALKAKAIFTATTLKTLLNSEEGSLVRFYLMERINRIVNIGNNPNVYSIECTPYFEIFRENIKQIHKIQNFPNVNAKAIYQTLLPKVKPRTMDLYPLYNWDRIWKYLNIRFINIKDRCTVYKFLYEILPTNKRLKEINLRQDSKCNYCDAEDSNLHKFLYCHKVQSSVQWLTKFIENVCYIKVNSLFKFLFLEFPYVNVKMVNTLTVIICCYISCIWLNRDKLEFIEKKLKAKIIRERNFLVYLHKEKSKKLFCEKFCDIKVGDMNLL